ncbi:hypothetical protein DLE60_03430 [Micromonospora globispora]|nr:hypothetical protein DLE60_03430 [Micromonospora globispora]RQW98456.1 hypothetical protein DKL51_10405 [Micromonospora globispora]
MAALLTVKIMDALVSTLAVQFSWAVWLRHARSRFVLMWSTAGAGAVEASGVGGFAGVVVIVVLHQSE